VTALRRLGPALLALALFGSAAGCDWPAGTRYVQRVFEATDVTRDIVYRTTTNAAGQTVQLKLDIYTPRGDTATNRPAVIWGFGGGWTFGDKNQLSSYATDSALRGYVGITIEYRTNPNGGNIIDLAGAAYDDTLASIAWVKANARDHGINPNAIVVGGYSAGAINALNVAFWPGERGPYSRAPVAGAIGIAGFSLGKPVAGDIPTLQFQGLADQIVPVATAKNTCDQSRAAGNVCTWFEYPGEDHLLTFRVFDSIQARTADWIFERVLWPLGYRPTRV
jgi:acetyl esterase/lipase